MDTQSNFPSSKIREHTASLLIEPLSPVDVSGLVTYRDFSALVRTRGWTAEFLVEKFKGVLEEPSAFFHRVLGGKLPEVVIPYKSVLRFYYAELSPLLAEGAARLCCCGCGSRVYGRKQYATGACRMRTARGRAETPKRGSEKPSKRKAFSVTNSGGGYLTLGVTV